MGKVSREREILRENQKEMLEILKNNNTVTGRMPFDKLIKRLYTAEERI